MLDRATPQPDGLVVVLGSGIAGLAAADKLCRAGWRVRVIERDAQPGGLHRARHIGPYTFDIGSIFYEDSARLFDLAPGLRTLCPDVIRQQRRIGPDGTIRHYPFEPREFLQRPWWSTSRSMIDMAWSRLTVRRDGTLDALSRKRLGNRLFEETGLASYITRFHHASPREIDEAFFFHRMAFVERFTRFDALARLALRSIRSNAPVSARTRQPLRIRPRQGFAPIFDPIVQRLERAGVEFHFGDELLSLKREGPLFQLRTTMGACRAEAVVSTIPLDTLHQTLFGQTSGLTSLDMTTLFVSAGHLAPQLGNVLFNFHPVGLWKRATIYSRLYPHAPTDREFLAVEATIPRDGRHDPQAVFADFYRHVTGLGLASELSLEGHEHVKNCYPLYAPGSDAIVQDVMRKITETGIVLAGRQGRFEYLPTSSRVIRRVTEELEASALLADIPQAAA